MTRKKQERAMNAILHVFTDGRVPGSGGFFADEWTKQEGRHLRSPGWRFTTKQQNPAVPYTPAEFAGEAAKCYAAGAAMVHVHARDDQGYPTHEINRIRATHDAIKDRTPELIVNLSSAWRSAGRHRRGLPRSLRWSPPWHH